jgi:hypothetical protein
MSKNSNLNPLCKGNLTNKKKGSSNYIELFLRPTDGDALEFKDMNIRPEELMVTQTILFATVNIEDEKYKFFQFE